MIDACQTSRDRALIAMLYDGGFRLKELATLSWGDVKFDEIGAENFFKLGDDVLAVLYGRLDRGVCERCTVRIFEPCGSGSRPGA